MGESVRVDKLVDGCENVLLARYIGERYGAVLFDPVTGWLDILYGSIKINWGHVYHGRLSSASTGRLAALRLPLAVLVAANMTSLDTGTSMSISSSKSDMVEKLMSRLV